MASMYDCIVIGGGHAGSCAALSAVENGCKRVLIVEKAPEEWAGGNGYFTAGAHRIVHGGLQDLLPIVHNVTPELASKIDMEPYTTEEFTADIMRLADAKSDPELVKVVVDGSRDAIEWLARVVGVHFIFSFHRQAYEVDGRQKFWGGMVLSVQDGGKGLIGDHQRALTHEGVDIWYNTPAVRLLSTESESRVTGVEVIRNGKTIEVMSHAVILAAGGYESSRDLRAKYLGSDWARARVRGTPYNTGDGIHMAQSIGAKLSGDWKGCHSTCWDANAPADAGDRVLSNQFTKSGYPLGIMISSEGVRFVDEGEDFRNYTYAKFGKAILHQSGGFAFQIWDSKTVKWLRNEEYGDDVVQKITADSLEELSTKLVNAGLQDPERCLETILRYNAAVSAHSAENPQLKWDPAVKDGLSTRSSHTSCELPKSNWALTIEEPPFLAVKVACGITFTFGGVAVDPHTTAILSEKTGQPIHGLFCTGEMVGGLFYNNYPGGSGLTAGAVLGRKAGVQAAKLASASRS